MSPGLWGNLTQHHMSTRGAAVAGVKDRSPSQHKAASVDTGLALLFRKPRARGGVRMGRETWDVVLVVGRPRKPEAVSCLFGGRGLAQSCKI